MGVEDHRLLPPAHRLFDDAKCTDSGQTDEFR
jgi:hypothetical protein